MDSAQITSGTVTLTAASQFAVLHADKATLSGTNEVVGQLVMTNSTVTGELRVRSGGLLRLAGGKVDGKTEVEAGGKMEWLAGYVGGTMAVDGLLDSSGPAQK